MPSYARCWHRGYVLLPVVLAIAVLAAITLLMNRDAGMGISLIAGTAESARTDNVTRAALQHALWQVNKHGCGPYTNLSTTAFDTHSYTATIVTNGGGATSNYNVPVDQDAWIEQSAPTTNNGSDVQLSVKAHSRIPGEFTSTWPKRGSKFPSNRWTSSSARIEPPSS